MLWDFPKPVVAKLNGHVRAGGTGLVAAADIVVAPTTATFAFNEVRIGVAPAIISVLCVRRMHPRAIFRYCLTGETFDAEQALAAGLITVAVQPRRRRRRNQPDSCRIRITEPHAVRITKQLLRELPEFEIGDGFTRTRGSFGGAVRVGCCSGRVSRAFREKRPPSWAGDSHSSSLSGSISTST